MSKQTNPRSTSVFILLLYLLFTTVSLVILVLGSSLYEKINTQAEDTFALRTSLSLVATKVRQAPTGDAISIDNSLGFPALVLSETVDGSTYQTWLYHYDGALWELYVEKGFVFAPSDGSRIVDIAAFDFAHDGGFILSAQTKTGASGKLQVSPRSTLPRLGGTQNEPKS